MIKHFFFFAYIVFVAINWYRIIQNLSSKWLPPSFFPDHLFIWKKADYLVPFRFLHAMFCYPSWCFRRCNANSVLGHIWWNWLKSQHFWSCTYQIVYTILNRPLRKKLLEVALNKKWLTVLNQNWICLRMFLLLKKRTIATYWRKTTIPFEELFINLCMAFWMIDSPNSTNPGNVGPH